MRIRHLVVAACLALPMAAVSADECQKMLGEVEALKASDKNKDLDAEMKKEVDVLLADAKKQQEAKNAEKCQAALVQAKLLLGGF